jgi:hypothetical protein
MSEFDIIDGRRVPPTRLNGDQQINGTHVGTIILESGHLVVAGRIEGTLSLGPGTTATIAGVQAGSVSMARGASARVTGAIEGSVRSTRERTFALSPVAGSPARFRMTGSS